MKSVSFRTNALVLLPLSFLIFLLVACPFAGQAQQKDPVTEKEYHKWGSLMTDKISDDGKWVSYSMAYQNISDTLFVTDTNGKMKYAFPHGNTGNFAGEWFACLSEKGMELLNIKTGNREIITGAMAFSLLSGGKYLAVTIKSGTGKKKLLVRKTTGETVESFDDVSTISTSHGLNQLLVANTTGGNTALALLSFQDGYKKTHITTQVNTGFYNMAWSINNKSFAYLTECRDTVKGNEIGFFNLKTKMGYTFSTGMQKHLSPKMGIVSHDEMELAISKDGNSVFFGIKKKELVNKTPTVDNVQIWNGNDKWVYQMGHSIAEWENVQKTVAWFPEKNFYRQLTTNELPWLMLSGNQEYAITANQQAYEPQVQYYGDMDYYVTNIATGEKRLWLKKQSGSPYLMNPSPDGSCIAYFRDHNWHVYNLTKMTTTNVTAKLGQVWDDLLLDPGNDISAFGEANWTTDGNLILYDQYDIWKVSPDGLKTKRLTHGREKQIMFRISETEKTTPLYQNFKANPTIIYDLSNQLILSAKGEQDEAHGFYTWHNKAGEVKLLFRNSNALYPVKSKNNVLVCREERFDMPQRLVKAAGSSPEEILFESNKQHKNFAWGKSEMIHYNDSEGHKLKAGLLYPANYDPAKKYPMIVYVYENQSKYINDYTNPSLEIMDGINVSNLTAKGYLVMLPDFYFKKGETGISATDCVVSATKVVIAMGIVKEDKIGLAGHSFGGYETNFIITQTNIFAAAVSGAGVSDMVSWYLTEGWFNGRPDMWRCETQQWRMGKSYYSDPEAYYRNSPIVHAEKITTPILLWSGKKDYQVDWHQNMEYYLALRRLKKKSILLLYPEEGHVLLDKQTQQDHTIKLEQWLDYWLKDQRDVPWIILGISDNN